MANINGDTANTNVTTIEDTAALSALGNYMAECHEQIMAKMKSQAKVCDLDSLLESNTQKFKKAIEHFVEEFAQLWEELAEKINRDIVCGLGIDDLMYSQEDGELWYGKTRIGKTEVILDQALARVYFTQIDKNWVEDTKQYGIFYCDIRGKLLEKFK